MEPQPKNKRRNRDSKDLPSIDNFFVPHDKVLVVKQFKEKVERMFEIQLHFEDPIEDGQWLVLQGDLGDRRNTKVIYRNRGFSHFNRYISQWLRLYTLRSCGQESLSARLSC